MELVVKLRKDVAEALRTGAASAAAMAAVGQLDTLRLKMRPMRENRQTGPLSSYFVVDIPPQLAEQARSQLSATEGVESAVAVPTVGLPSGSS